MEQLELPQTSRRSLITAVLMALLVALGSTAVLGAAPAEQTIEPRIVVVAYPDLVGPGPGAPTCSGCDMFFTDADTLASSADPLPLLEFVLTDDAGAELERKMTSALSDGRRPTSFTVNMTGTYTVSLAEVPDGWEMCPTVPTSMTVEPDDFDADGRVQLDFWMWHGCQVPTPTTTVTATATTPATAPPTQPPATATQRPTEPPSTATPVEDDDDDDADEDDGDDADRDDEDAAPASGDMAPMHAQPTGLGEIRGLVFGDVNADGQLGASEPGIGGVPVRLEGEGLTRHMTTPPDGTYAFGDLPTGHYDVIVDVPDNALTTVGRYEDISVQGSVVMGFDFGLRPATDVSDGHPDAAPMAKPRLPSTGMLPGSASTLLAIVATIMGGLAVVGLALEGAPFGRPEPHRKDDDDA